MANQWLRLWHEMPNDPKWRTVARVSKQPISLVLAVFLHLMVDASRNVTRGHATVTQEDLASAVDCDEEQIQAILGAMQGRVLDGMTLLGWDKRQPKREDSGDQATGAMSAAERKRAQRQREKNAIENDANSDRVTGPDEDQPDACHAESRNVTLDKDKDKDKEPPTGVQGGKPPNPAVEKKIELPDWIPGEPWDDFVAMRRAKGRRAPFTVAAAKGILADLGRLRDRGQDVTDVLRQSVVNGWSGVFEVKAGAGSPSPGAVGAFV